MLICVRYYDPYSQKFLSEDPMAFDGGDTNFYRYVSNQPLTSRDPFGLTGLAGIGVIIGGIGAEVLPGLCGAIAASSEELQKISEKRKACEEQWYQRVAACQPKDGAVKETCLKVAKIEYELCNQRAEGQLQ